MILRIHFRSSKLNRHALWEFIVINLVPVIILERCLIGSMPTQVVWKNWIDRRYTLCAVIKKKNTSRITPLLLGMEEFNYDLGWRVPDTFVYNNLFILSLVYSSFVFFRWWRYPYGIWPDITIFSGSCSTLQHVH